VTYLEIVNEVLARLRQDAITTVVSQDDESAKMVIALVNDAKTKVENAWNWNVLRTEWVIPTVQSTKTYALTGSDTYVRLDYVTEDNQGYFLNQSSPRDLKRKHQGGVAEAFPLLYAINGTNASREIQIELWPTPSVAGQLTVEGFQNQVALSGDDDVLLVPHLPVVYEALAMAARERGEVGGQTALEIFGVAKKYLEDAVALDSALSPLENVWYEV